MDQRSNIAILGYGVEGKAVYNYLYDNGYHNITVCDQNVDLKVELKDGISARLGKNYLEGLDDFDVIFRSPGIRYLDPHIQFALSKGVKVSSSTSYFLSHRPCKVIGVTGTKGKGTTCTLIHEMLKSAKIDSHLAGNIGEPSISLFEKIDSNSVVVLELSSFQLQDVNSSPDYAVLLNTTEDHLDYHADKDEYMCAKESLLANQKQGDLAVLNKDYEYVKYYEPLVKGIEKFISVKGEVKDGAFVEDSVIFYSENGKREKICKTSDVALLGSHNLENVLPSIVIAKIFDVPTKNIVKVVKSFKGLPHRLEFVREIKGVRFYDDSFSTGPNTSMAAVDSFEEPTILIAGGSDKELDYMDWAKRILTKASLKAVILIGDTAQKMEDAILEADKNLAEGEGSPTEVLRRENLEEAVLTAFAESGKGWVVVMSPASASFDMFKDYKERGDKFKEYVEKLQ